MERVLETFAGKLGIVVDQRNHDQVVEVLRERMAKQRCAGITAYADLLASAAGHGELRALAERLTVGETYFFRHLDQFRAFSEVALPDRIGARAAARRLEILSVGCASGEEAYTLAMLCADRNGELDGWDVRIRGIDVNPAVVRKATAGVYSTWSLRETPDSAVARWFGRKGNEWVLSEDIRRAATFHERNLVEDDSAFWQAGTFDIVFFRNVLIYFSPQAARDAIARIARAMSPGGYLFLGSAETLRGISGEFHLAQSHDCFYYVRKDGAPALPDRGAAVRAFPDASPRQPTFDPIAEPDQSWVAAIGRSSDRIARLAGDTGGPSAQSVPTPPPGASLHGASLPEPGAGVGVALDLFKRDRFSEALEHIEGLPSGSQQDPETQVLRAVVLTNLGRLQEADRVCQDILGFDEQNAAAHYLRAVCREHAGDLDGAIRHAELAAYLEPDFAMARLHLGRLSRRRADKEAARRELTTALGLLSREGSNRLMLFGGGFGREALEELCRNELRACGGSA